MLSFTVVHALTACLIAADADADALGWGQPATLLLLHDQPTTAARCQREVRSLEFPLRREDLPTDAGRLPALLQHLAGALRDPAAGTPYRATLAAILGRIHATAPDARVLAWAACYDDIHTLDGPPRPVRRVDAVDTDGRVYQLTHLRGEDQPVLLVDDTPDLTASPTGPGLAALLTASTHHTSTITGRGMA
ncbi:hypothetical protein OG992_33100 [Micromonospora sp. NBC_00362]|uniref:hypothetical protein n=1 Tax=Micromonospora sp. NBC_00362 TaxID=2975975 RepID=UPI002256416D|nr:hypothetical protein [Micromonospora sp. NBC_00362]MCX5122003.1 hypothetical protein [Micromonospora sp. NBC_00362]